MMQKYKIITNMAETFRVPRQFLAFISGPCKNSSGELYIHGKNFNAFKKINNSDPHIITALKSLSNVETFRLKGFNISKCITHLPNTIFEPIQVNINEYEQFDINENTYTAVPLNVGKLLLYLCSMHPDERGIIKVINIAQTAEDLDCCEKTIFNALKRLENDKMISYSNHFLSGHITVKLNGKYTECHKEGTQGNGYVRMFSKQLREILTHDHARDLRLELRALLQSEIDYNIYGHISILSANTTANCFPGAKKSYTYNIKTYTRLKTVHCLYIDNHILAQPCYTHDYYKDLKKEAKKQINIMLNNNDFRITAEQVKLLDYPENGSDTSEHEKIQKENIYRNKYISGLVHLYMSYGKQALIEAITAAQIIFTKSRTEKPILQLISSIISNPTISA